MGATEDAKRDLRARLRALRRGSPLAQGEAIAAALRALLVMVDHPSSMLLGAFNPLPGEPDVLPAIRWAQSAGHRVLLPRTAVGSRMHWLAWDGTSPLAPDRYGLRAPVGDPEPGMPAGADLLLVPALAVDLRGTRLGYGAGYYDRALEGVPAWPTGPLRVAVVHPWEVLDEPLPRDDLDASMDVALCADGPRWLSV